jgi:deoxyribonuclease-1-like protein
VKQYAFASIILFAMFFFIHPAYAADCRGCCSGGGGLECFNGITRCSDGSAISQKCLQNGCDVCPETETTAQPTGSKTITIASFNIQLFGRTKASNFEVMGILAETIAQFDLVAIQGIREKTGTAIKILEVKADDFGNDYNFIIGPRLGRTTSKEQYAFFYKTSAIELKGSYTFSDKKDKFQRAPFIADFKAKGGAFDFVVINIHTDPDDATNEINALPEVIFDAKNHYSEPDVILLGDLNADGIYYDENNYNLPLRDSKYIWLITNNMDTTVAGPSNTYDRIIITSATAEDFMNIAGVFRFDQQFEMICKPKEVSDHYPVFAKFRIDKDTD